MKRIENLAHSLSIGLVTLFPKLKKRLQVRPKLSLTIEPSTDSYSIKRWASTRNENLYIYETSWRFLIKIKNNTPFDAYFPKISFDRTLPHYSRIGILNHYVPIFANSETILEGEHTILEECADEYNTTPKGVPDALKKVSMLLEYQNEDKVKFYTVSGFNNRVNTFYRFRPSEFA